MIRYQIAIANDAGEIQSIPRDFVSCNYQLRADGEIGMCEMVLPRAKYQDLMNESNPDYRIQIWRSVNGGNYRLDGNTEFFALKWNKTDDYITITAPSIQHLLSRRINAYYAGFRDIVTGYGASYSGPVTTIMYNLVNANFGGGFIDPNRDVFTSAYIPPNLTINGPLGTGPTLNIGANRTNVLTTLLDVSEASYQQGTWAAGIVSSDGSEWYFNAYLNFAGVDRRTTVLLSPDLKNVQNAQLTISSVDEKSSVIAAGRGTGRGRYVQNALNPSIIAKSIYGYKEMFAENTNLRNPQVINLARSKVQEFRESIEFSCDLTQTAGCIRGIHYNIGDYMRVSYLGKRFDLRLNLIDVSLTGSSATESARLVL